MYHIGALNIRKDAGIKDVFRFWEVVPQGDASKEGRIS